MKLMKMQKKKKKKKDNRGKSLGFVRLVVHSSCTVINQIQATKEGSTPSEVTELLSSTLLGLQAQGGCRLKS